jgi:hypothetical protein
MVVTTAAVVSLFALAPLHAPRPKARVLATPSSRTENDLRMTVKEKEKEGFPIQDKDIRSHPWLASVRKGTDR